jgi:hypothetical protein
LAALASSRFAARLAPRLAAGSGAGFLAAGLVALAVLPSTSPALVAAALALCGAGLGLAVPVLTQTAVRPDEGVVRRGTVTIGARHAGLVVALALVAPLLSHDLTHAGRESLLGGTRVILDGNAPLRQKVPIALDLRTAIQSAPNGVVPDLAEPFDRRGAAQDANLRHLRDDLVGEIRGALTRGFRNAFLLSATFSVAARSPILLARRLVGRAARRPARGGRARLTLVAVTLLAQLALGGFCKDSCLADPSRQACVRDGGIDGAVQRFALGSRRGCVQPRHLRRSSCCPSRPRRATAPPRWDRATIDRALQAGLDRASHTAPAVASSGTALAFALGVVATRRLVPRRQRRGQTLEARPGRVPAAPDRFDGDRPRHVRA